MGRRRERLRRQRPRHHRTEPFALLEVAATSRCALPPTRCSGSLADAVAGLEWQPSVTGGLCKLLQECRKTFREGLFF
jgi:hypothetical protein